MKLRFSTLLLALASSVVASSESHRELPEFQCRCEASFEHFYSRRLAQRRASDHSISLRYPYDYTTTFINGDGYYVVEGVIVLPKSEPQCESVNKRWLDASETQVTHAQFLERELCGSSCDSGGSDSGESGKNGGKGGKGWSSGKSGKGGSSSKNGSSGKGGKSGSSGKSGKYASKGKGKGYSSKGKGKGKGTEVCYYVPGTGNPNEGNPDCIELPPVHPCERSTSQPSAENAPGTDAPIATPAPTESPVQGSTASPTVRPVSAGTPIPTSSPVSLGTPTPTIAPVVAGTPAPSVAPVPAGTSSPTIAPVPLATSAPTGSQSIIGRTTPSPTVESQPPVAVCADLADICVGETISATQIGSGSYDPDGNIVDLSLNNYGPFPSPGRKIVCLTVTDNDGYQATCCAKVFVISCATASPTSAPTSAPVSAPTSAPVSAISGRPTFATTPVPTAVPTGGTPFPTTSPVLTTGPPTAAPSIAPVTSAPTSAPVTSPGTPTPTATPVTSPGTSAPTATPSTTPGTSAPTQPPATPTPTQPPVSEITSAPTAGGLPTAVCNNTDVCLGDTITPADVDGGSFDSNGSIVSTAVSFEGPFDELQAVGVTLTVTDNDGLSSSCRAIVTVQECNTAAPTSEVGTSAPIPVQPPVHLPPTHSSKSSKGKGKGNIFGGKGKGGSSGKSYGKSGKWSGKGKGGFSGKSGKSGKWSGKGKSGSSGKSGGKSSGKYYSSTVSKGKGKGYYFWQH